jgi:hypothetical protein
MRIVFFALFPAVLGAFLTIEDVSEAAGWGVVDQEECPFEPSNSGGQHTTLALKPPFPTKVANGRSQTKGLVGI